MKGAFIRILARWVAGILLGIGLIGPDTANFLATDPDVLLIISALIGIITEGSYFRLWLKSK